MTMEEKNIANRSLVRQLCKNADAVYMEHYGGYGIQATANIAKYDRFCTIPHSMEISSFHTFAWSDMLKHVNEYCNLVGRVLYEKFVNDEDTFARRYIYRLPEQFKTLYTLSDEVKTFLKDTLAEDYPYYGEEYLNDAFFNFTSAFKDYPDETASCP
jgi:hypothetical protein